MLDARKLSSQSEIGLDLDLKAELPDSVPFSYRYKMEKTGEVVLAVRVNQHAAGDPLLVKEVEGFVKELGQKNGLDKTVVQWIDAQNSDLRAQSEWINKEATILREIKENFSDDKVRSKILNAQIGDLAKKSSVSLSSKAANVGEAAKNIKQLQKELSEKVAAGDRAGVKTLLEDALPWKEMSPSSQRMWRTWLDAIEHPEPGPVTIFRGIKSVPGTDAAKEGILSGALGHANSSEEMFDLLHAKNVPEQLAQHSYSSNGSPFISATVDPKVAASASKEIVALKIDPRRLAWNLHGKEGEKEVLVPLIIFPDEIIQQGPKAPSVTAITETKFYSDSEKKWWDSLSAAIPELREK